MRFEPRSFQSRLKYIKSLLIIGSKAQPSMATISNHKYNQYLADLNSGFKVNTIDMSQWLTSCHIMQNTFQKSKHTSLLNGGVTCNMTLNDGLLF
jgi:hypothetical protein